MRIGRFSAIARELWGVTPNVGGARAAHELQNVQIRDMGLTIGGRMRPTLGWLVREL